MDAPLSGLYRGTARDPGDDAWIVMAVWPRRDGQAGAAIFYEHDGNHHLAVRYEEGVLSSVDAEGATLDVAWAAEDTPSASGVQPVTLQRRLVRLADRPGFRHTVRRAHGWSRTVELAWARGLDAEDWQEPVEEDPEDLPAPGWRRVLLEGDLSLG